VRYERVPQGIEGPCVGVDIVAASSARVVWDTAAASDCFETDVAVARAVETARDTPSANGGVEGGTPLDVHFGRTGHEETKETALAASMDLDIVAEDVVPPDTTGNDATAEGKSRDS